MLKETIVFVIEENDANRRIDRVLRKFLEKESLSQIYSAIRKGYIRLNGKKLKQGQITKNGDKLEIAKFLLERKNSTEATKATNNKTKNKLNEEIQENKPTDEDLDIILKTRDLLFINKKQGQIVHGKDSISEMILKYHMPKQESLSFKPGPLHRLDKDTSGIICFSQSLKGAQAFSQAIKTKKLNKYYLGIIEGVGIKPILNSPIEGKACKTLCKVIKSNKEKNLSLVEFKLITGRKHQIRIQCQKAGHPLLHDRKYGSKQGHKNNDKNKAAKYFLHAQRIEFDDELLALESFKGLPKVINAELAKDFRQFLINNFD